MYKKPIFQFYQKHFCLGFLYKRIGAIHLGTGIDDEKIGSRTCGLSNVSWGHVQMNRISLDSVLYLSHQEFGNIFSAAIFIFPFLLQLVQYVPFATFPERFKAMPSLSMAFAYNIVSVLLHTKDVFLYNQSARGYICRHEASKVVKWFFYDACSHIWQIIFGIIWPCHRGWWSICQKNVALLSSYKKLYLRGHELCRRVNSIN